MISGFDSAGGGVVDRCLIIEEVVLEPVVGSCGDSWLTPVPWFHILALISRARACNFCSCACAFSISAMIAATAARFESLDGGEDVEEEEDGIGIKNELSDDDGPGS